MKLTLGFSTEDILAICGSRAYVFFLDAAPTERLLTQEGSLLTYLEEEADLGAEGGGKLRRLLLRMLVRRLVNHPLPAAGPRPAMGNAGELKLLRMLCARPTPAGRWAAG